MMASFAPPAPLDASTFWDYTLAHAEARLELIAGEVREMGSNIYSSLIAANLVFWLKSYVREHGNQGFITTEAGGYIVGADVYQPNVAYLSKARQAEPTRKGFNPIPPDLAVEVISPSDDLRDLRLKVANYLAVGTLVWVVDPTAQTVEVYQAGQAASLLHVDDTLTAPSLFPDFSLPFCAIFEV